MTKAEIINKIAKETGVDKIVALNIVEAFMENIKDSLVREENVFLRGFGSFMIKKRAEKTARNIKKNVVMILPERNIAVFKPAKSLAVLIEKIKDKEQK
jgi:DNA-binding protein HU-beta